MTLILAVVLIVLSAIVAWTHLLPAPPPKALPNIIVIVMDTVRQSATSLSSSGEGITPFLENLAGQGVVFDNAYSTYDSAAESHFSIFTGLKEIRPDREELSLAHHLRQLGYDTIGISANRNVNKESMRALRPFRTFLSPVGDHLSLLRPETQSAINENASKLIKTYEASNNTFNRNINTSSANAVNALLSHVLQTAKRPAFLFLNFMDAHDPYFPPESFHDDGREQPPENFSNDLRLRSLPNWMNHPESIEQEEKRRDFMSRLKNVRNRKWNLSDDLSEAALTVYRNRYLEEITYLDSQLEETAAILQRHRFFDDSVLIVTSDHGESFGEKGYVTHSMNNQGDIETTRHVPLLIVPELGRDNEGPHVEERVSIADIGPTLYDIVGIDDDKFIESYGDRYGKSLIQYLSADIARDETHQATFETAQTRDTNDKATSTTEN